MVATDSSNPSGFSSSELELLNVWRLPDVSVQPDAADIKQSQDSESVPISVLTVDEIEAMQKQAYDEAFAQGKKEGYSEGFKEGSKRGYAENGHLLQNKAAEFAVLMESLSQPFKALDAEVEKELVKLAIGIAAQIVRREIKQDPEQIIAVVREAIKILPLSAQKITLHLHPQDADLVRSALSLDEMSSTWKIVENPVITRGGCKVDAEVSHIDATVEKRLTAVIATIMGDEREQDRNA